MTQCNNIPLFVYAKAPVAGEVKTRLQSNCSAEQAADIAEILLTETVRRCHVAWPGELIISVGNEPEHPFVKALAGRYQIKVVKQSEGDLGVKMLNTFRGIETPAVIIGADAALVTPEILQNAYTQMQQKHNVIGPSEDGGYYLIGLMRPEPMLFQNVEWGSDKVLGQTLELAKKWSINLHRLPELMDIDEWADVEQAALHIPQLSDYLEQKGLERKGLERKGLER
jgi:hypothetical protein